MVFTDLINMVSAPDQKLRIAAINPGIEVTDGVVRDLAGVLGLNARFYSEEIGKASTL